MDDVRTEEFCKTTQELIELRTRLEKAEAERDSFRDRAVKAELEGGWNVDPSAYVPISEVKAWRELGAEMQRIIDAMSTQQRQDLVPDWFKPKLDKELSGG